MRQDARMLAALFERSMGLGEAWEVFGTWSGEAGVPTSPTRWPTAAGVATRPRSKTGKGARRVAASRAASSRFDEDDVFWFNKNCAEIDE